MPRKGNRKVRSGCLTCKIRKVKCDEFKPSCNRCTSTGRKCDGYAVVSGKNNSGPALCSGKVLLRTEADGESRNCKIMRLRSNLLRSHEVRALEFFCQVAGPQLSGDLDNYFWSQLVGQLTHCEDAVRHAMVSISILYEQRPPHNMQSQSLRHTQALTHYNAAVQALRSVQDVTVVLLTCILFVCIEFLLGSPQLATDHCRHGTLMLNAYGDASTVARQVLGPMYRRMSIFPYFFGSTVSTFPPILGPGLQIQEDFYSFGDAQPSLDELLSQSVRFVRKAGEYRLGRLMHSAIPSTLRKEQNVLRALLERWNSAFQRFMTKQTIQRAYYALQIRYLVARIWTSTALDRSELAFDRHLGHFRMIRDLAAELVDSEPAVSARRTRASFTFDMGFLPLLYFVVIKCRELKLRISALSLMIELAAEKEGLWDVDTMSVVGKRIIELEHGVSLTNGDAESANIEVMSVLPAESRVWDSVLGSETCSLNEQGNLIRERKATFFFQASNGELVHQDERLFFCRI